MILEAAGKGERFVCIPIEDGGHGSGLISGRDLDFYPLPVAVKGMLDKEEGLRVEVWGTLESVSCFPAWGDLHQNHYYVELRVFW